MKNFFKVNALSAKDFNPKYNMTWEGHTFEKRGPPDHRYNYYFPVGWKGYALNTSSLKTDNDNWLKMDGNSEEWRIFYHGTSQGGMKKIPKEGLKAGEN